MWLVIRQLMFYGTASVALWQLWEPSSGGLKVWSLILQFFLTNLAISLATFYYFPKEFYFYLLATSLVSPVSLLFILDDRLRLFLSLFRLLLNYPTVLGIYLANSTHKYITVLAVLGSLLVSGHLFQLCLRVYKQCKPSSKKVIEEVVGTETAVQVKRSRSVEQISQGLSVPTF